MNNWIQFKKIAQNTGNTEDFVLGVNYLHIYTKSEEHNRNFQA